MPHYTTDHPARTPVPEFTISPTPDQRKPLRDLCLFCGAMAELEAAKVCIDQIACWDRFIARHDAEIIARIAASYRSIGASS